MEIGNLTSRLGEDLGLWQKLLLDIKYIHRIIIEWGSS